MGIQIRHGNHSRSADAIFTTSPEPVTEIVLDVRLLLQHIHRDDSKDRGVGCVRDLDSLSAKCIQAVADESHTVILAVTGSSSSEYRL